VTPRVLSVNPPLPSKWRRKSQSGSTSYWVFFLRRLRHFKKCNDSLHRWLYALWIWSCLGLTIWLCTSDASRSIWEVAVQLGCRGVPLFLLLSAIISTYLTHAHRLYLPLVLFPFENCCLFTFFFLYFIVSLKITKDSVFIFNAHLCISVFIFCVHIFHLPLVAVRLILLQQLKSINGLFWLPVEWDTLTLGEFSHLKTNWSLNWLFRGENTSWKWRNLVLREFEVYQNAFLDQRKGKVFKTRGEFKGNSFLSSL